VTLPLALRNRLADLILEGFHDVAARRVLEAIAAICGGATRADGQDALSAAGAEDLLEWDRGALRIKGGWRPHAREMAERAERARRALDNRPLDPPDAPLGIALAEAAVLFDAQLYFEVHERLEPYWLRAEGREREALQGLIQVAVALHHLANGNTAGARSLLHDGIAKVVDRRIDGIPLDPFADALLRCLDDVKRLGAEATAQFDWDTVPGFPARAT